MGCAYNLLGAILLIQDKIDSAELAFLSAQELLPDSTFESLNLATLHHRKGNYKRSSEYIKIGLDIATYILAKGNSQEHFGCLVFRINNRGSYIVANIDYCNQILPDLNYDVTSYKQITQLPFDTLKNIGYGEKWFVCDFEKFIIKNKDLLFKQI
jgi:hypothetical protein